MNNVTKRNISYYLKAKTHALIHSNELYTFYKSVFLGRVPKQLKENINSYKKTLLLSVGDVSIPQNGGYGAPSKKNKAEKTLAELQGVTKVSMRYAKLLYNLINTIDKPVSVLELGTSTGVSAVAMAANEKCKTVDTVDANGDVLTAIKPFLPAKINAHAGLFSDVVPQLTNASHYDLVFIDGDHQSESVLKWFTYFSELHEPPKYLIFDDINWSDDMLLAWEEITKRTANYYTIETFRMGLVWFKPQQRKMHLKAWY